MPQSVIAAEPVVRLGFFLGVLLLMALWEWRAPRRPQAIGRSRRWPNNLGLVVLNTLAVRLVFPLAGVGMAFLAQTKGWGLFNVTPMPAWFAIPAKPAAQCCFTKTRLYLEPSNAASRH